MVNKCKSDGASVEIMSHSRHTSLKSQQAYQRNMSASTEQFQLSLSPVPFPKINTPSKNVTPLKKRKNSPKHGTKPAKKARMKAPPKEDLKKAIPVESSKGGNSPI